MEGAFTFTCQLCRARLTLVGNLEAAESASWAGGRGFLVPPHLQTSVFDQTNVDESFIVLDGKRQGPQLGAGPPQPPPGHMGLLPHQQLPQQQPQHRHSPAPPHLQPQPQQPPPQQQLLPQPHSTSPRHQAAVPSPQPLQAPPQGPPQPHPPQAQPHLPQRGLEESFVVLGAASVLRPASAPHPHPQPQPPGVSPRHVQALQQVQQQQQQQQVLKQQQQPAATGRGGGAGAASAQEPPQQALAGGPGGQSSPAQPPPLQLQRQPAPSPPTQPLPAAQLAVTQPHPHPHPPISYPQQQQQPSPPGGLPRRGGGGGGGPLQGGAGDAEVLFGSPAGSAGGGGRVSGGGGGGGGGPPGSGLDSKLQALAQLFEMASTNTQVDHPLCMDCVGQLKEEMETQIAEAEREIAAYSACLAALQGTGPGVEAAAAAAAGGGGEAAAAAGGRGLEEEYCQLEEISRLEQERDQERARAEVLEADLAGLVSELSSLSAASADLASLEERYWHDADDFELLLRAHTDERGALLAKIDRAGQRLQLLKNTSVLYDAFKIWHDGPFGTISGFRLGRTPEVAVEWDEINAAWGQAVLLLHTMAQMCKLQFSQHRLLPLGSHPRVADKRATYDLFGPVSKLWSANYDRAMVGYLACLREFGEHARRKDAADGKPTQFNFPFPIDADKVNNHTIKLTLNKDVRWTKALKFMLANLKIALQWCVKQDGGGEVPQLAQLPQEGPQTLPEAG